MKRILSAALAFLLLAAVSVNARAGDDAPAPDFTAGLSAAEGSAAVGGTAYVELALATENPLIRSYSSLELVLRYDPSMLAFDREGSVLPDTHVIADDDESAGVLRLLCYGGDVPLGERFAVAFTVRKAGASTVELTYAAADRRVMADLRDAPEAALADAAAEITGKASGSGSGSGSSGRDASSAALTETTYTVTFSGAGAGDATGETTAAAGRAYYFYLHPEDGYDYRLTAEMGGSSVEVLRVGSYACRVADVTGPLRITVEKTASDGGADRSAQTAEADAHIYDYLRLDEGLRLYLITVAGDPGEGCVFTYDGNPMLWSEIYDAYAWLAVSGDDIGTFGRDAADRLGGAERPEEETEAVELSAEEIRRLCSAGIGDPDGLSVPLLLAADRNGSRGVDILDAVAAMFDARKEAEDK